MRQSLRFTQYAWRKLIWMRDRQKKEVAGWAVTDPDDNLLVRDIAILPQIVTYATFDFDKQGMSDYTVRRVREGMQPNQFLRVWIHTHPGESAEPSTKDLETFRRDLAEYEWQVMFIIGETGKYTCTMRLRLENGLVAETALPVEMHMDPAHVEEWEKEFKENVKNYVAPVVEKRDHLQTAVHGELPWNQQRPGESKKQYKKRMRLLDDWEERGPVRPLQFLGGQHMWADAEETVWEWIPYDERTKKGGHWERQLLSVREAKDLVEACARIEREVAKETPNLKLCIGPKEGERSEDRKAADEALKAGQAPV